MKNIILGAIFIIVVFAFLYYSGYIENIPSIKDVPYVDNLKLSDQCVRKKISGEYDMTIFFEESDNIDYVNQELEIYYKIELIQKGCEIYGKGDKVGDEYTDFNLNKKVKNSYDLGKFPVVINGRIENDTITFDLSLKTASTQDHVVKAKFLSKNSTINSTKGSFYEELNNSSGSAKISKPE